MRVGSPDDTIESAAPVKPDLDTVEKYPGNVTALRLAALEHTVTVRATALEREIASARARIADLDAARVEATDREAAMHFEIGPLRESAERHREQMKLLERLSLVARVEGIELVLGQCAAAIHDLDRRLAIEEGKTMAEVREVFGTEYAERLRALETRFETFKVRDSEAQDLGFKIKAVDNQARHRADELRTQLNQIHASITPAIARCNERLVKLEEASRRKFFKLPPLWGHAMRWISRAHYALGSFIERMDG
jgi:chromosome segregation ATPase